MLALAKMGENKKLICQGRESEAKIEHFLLKNLPEIADQLVVRKKAP